MSLINQRLVSRMRWPLLAAPVETRIGHRCQRRERRTVPVIEGQVAVGIAELITEQLVGPLERPADRLGIGIEQQLVGIEAQSALGNIGSMHAIAVQLAGPDVRQINVPHAAGALADADALLVVAGCIEQTEL